MLADRAIAANEILKAESRVTKIHKLEAGWWALLSGRLDFGHTVLEWAQEDYKRYNTPGAERGRSMPECIKLAYQSCRKIEICDKILHPLLLTEEWYQDRARYEVSPNDEFFLRISDRIEKYSAETSIMVCGFDERLLPQIYVIRNPGQQDLWSPEGFGVIGIGDNTARSRLYILKANRDNTIANALYNLYDAKELCAATIPDIGHESDAFVLVHNRPGHRVADEKMSLIQKLYETHPKSPYDTQSPMPSEDLSEIDAWSRKLAGV
jgi:hypothetical protein